MSLCHGDVIAGRFEVTGDPARVHSRSTLWRSLYRGGGLSLTEEDLWVRGLDRHTGQVVWIAPPGEGHTWDSDFLHETAAERLQRADLAPIVSILHVGPGVVFGPLSERRERPRLTVEEAAGCAVEACAVAARLHEVGVAGELAFGPTHLRLVREQGRWHIRWRAPGLEPVDRSELGPVPPDEPPDPVQSTIHQIVRFFAALAPGRAAEELRSARPGDVAALAQALLRLAGSRPDLEHLAADLPAIGTLPPVRHNWDRLVERGEALLRSGNLGFGQFVSMPLAAAYHQRACRAAAAGDTASALRDVERALVLDPYPVYTATRAVLFDRDGRRDESRREIAAAIEAAEAALRPVEERWASTRAFLEAELERLKGESGDEQQQREEYLRQLQAGPFTRELSFVGGHAAPPRPRELARLYEVRGLFGLHDKAPDTLEADLQRARELRSLELALDALERTPSWWPRAASPAPGAASSWRWRGRALVGAVALAGGLLLWMLLRP